MPNEKATKFVRLRVEGWRQFGNVDIELHPKLTIITGANGSGKSTLLGILAGHFGYNRPLLATPTRDSSGKFRYLTGIVNLFRSLFPPARTAGQQVGEVHYNNGMRAIAQLPVSGTIQYTLSLIPPQAVLGFHVNSHRKLGAYKAVGQIPTQPLIVENAYSQFNAEMTNNYQGGNSVVSSMFRIKEALISMAVLGAQTKYVQSNEFSLKALDGFSDALRNILPSEIGFIDLSIRTPDVVLVTKTGDFLIDAASGGLAALIEIVWQIHMYSLQCEAFVVTIDEPENHLHPSMQRTLMSSLIKVFPKIQFIVATHSPFIVSAARDSSVYVLKYEDKPETLEADDSVPPHQKRFVSSIRLDSVNRAGTASQILRDVLGLSTTYPEWVSEDINKIIESYQGRPFNEELLKALRKDLEKSGLSDLYPDATEALAKQ